MLAPGAMGEVRETGDDKTADTEAENRRVVVRILQNKGIAGLVDKAFIRQQAFSPLGKRAGHISPACPIFLSTFSHFMGG